MHSNQSSNNDTFRDHAWYPIAGALQVLSQSREHSVMIGMGIMMRMVMMTAMMILRMM